MTKLNLFLIIISLLVVSCKGGKSPSQLSKENITNLSVERKIPEVQHPLDTTTNPVQVISHPEVQYHIVAASFKFKNQAENLRKQLYRKGYPSKVLLSNGRYRVTLQTFVNKEMALKELVRLRELNQKPDLWLLAL